MALFTIVLFSFAAYLIGLAVYRLYFSPLARFPGPKLAALSRWYEGYYDIVLKGQFFRRIEEMHERYGPIVRVTPDEVHIRDSSFWDEVFVRRPKARKSAAFVARFGNPGSMFTVTDAGVHRMFRAPLNPFFSRRAIINQEEQVQRKAESLCQGFEQQRTKDAVFRVTDPFAAFACDVVYQYAFGFNYHQVEQEGWKENFHDPFVALTEFGHLSTQLPWMTPVVEKYIPEAYLGNDIRKMLKLRRDFVETIMKVRQDFDNDKSGGDDQTVFHAILRSDLSSADKGTPRLISEAQTVIAGGVTTTAWALTLATFHILSNPEVLSRLSADLREAIPDVSAPDAFNYGKLEKLPYLSGCVREGIRISYGVSGRLTRVFAEPLVYKDWTIPPDTEVSMSIGDISFDESIFKDARQFKPERWGSDAPKLPDGSSLENYFVAFSKGPRMCLGINLAFMEMYIVLAHIYRRFSLQLYETDASDVEMAHDFFIPIPRLDSKGVRVKVTETIA